jgi:hypothetical protein
MNDNENKILDEQIGSAGGDMDNLTMPKDEGSESLGRLQHIPGQQQDLNEAEKKSMNDFDKMTANLRVVKNDNSIETGWIPIDRGDMGVRSQFYPSSWQFRVKPATVQAIKNWSSIDEENLAVVNNVMNEIVKSCVSIFDTDMNIAVSWDKINSWDRFWFILKVREYTFDKGEQAMEFDEDCDNCGGNIHYVLRANNLFYEFPDEAVVERHWNMEGRFWDIDPKEYDVNYHKIKFFVPTIGKDNAILQWLYAQNNAGKNIDEVFVKFLPYMLERAPKDSNVLDRMIKDCHNEFKRWDTETFMFYDEVRRNITINPSEKLTEKCPNCGEEVRSTVRFPNGIKYLFAVQGRHRKFGSK